MEIDTKSPLNPIVQVRISFSKSGILGKKGKSAKKYLKKLQLFVKVSLKNCYH
jgi:hypothetical protein